MSEDPVRRAVEKISDKTDSKKLRYHTSKVRANLNLKDVSKLIEVEAEHEYFSISEERVAQDGVPEIEYRINWKGLAMGGILGTMLFPAIGPLVIPKGVSMASRRSDEDEEEQPDEAA